MGDTAGQQQREQRAMSEFDMGEYITSTTGNDGQHGPDLDNIFAEFQQSQAPNPALDSNMASQGILGSNNGGMEYLSQNQSQPMITAEMLKGRLEQQMKLQQLQQLQNQILQQQIDIISQSSTNDQQKEVIFHGLLTPGPSAELRGMVSKDLVSPMILQSDMYMNHGPSATTIVNQLSPHQHGMNPSFSAPAALAFQNSPPFPLPSPADDLSPLTSPWLLPQASQQVPPQQTLQRAARLKRAVSNSGDEQGGMRKRASPNIHPSASHSRRNGPSTSSTSSSTSTPAMRGTGPAPFVTASNDTPSPVDLSMPPPAPPAPTNSVSSASSSTTISASGSTSVSPNIAPVTPASIMNLRRLTTGLIPSNTKSVNTEGHDGNVASGARKKGKGVARAGAAVAAGVTTRGRRGSVAKPSPSLKPLLPGAIAPTPISPLAQASNSAQQSLGSSANYILPQNGTVGPRKTSHKAAEQKRRDSLKTSFDDLRLLLPPVPLPEEAGDEPPLPGSMPPRGPPKGDADGPNRGVSKLALLRCGNTYIRELKGKVERRDREIDTLRDEVRRLRMAIGEDDVGELDLERDVDEGAIPVACPTGNECVEESGMDGDEEGE